MIFRRSTQTRAIHGEILGYRQNAQAKRRHLEYLTQTTQSGQFLNPGTTASPPEKVLTASRRPDLIFGKAHCRSLSMAFVFQD